MSKNSKMIKMNYENMMKIDDKYQDLVTDIVCYIRSELITADAEEAINDINVILLGAQERGENLNEVIGDYKIFCDDVINSYKSAYKSYRFRQIIDSLPISVFTIIFFIALDIISDIVSSKPTEFKEVLFFNYNLTLAPFLTSIIALFSVFRMMKFLLKKSENENSKKDSVLFGIFYVAIVCTLVGLGFLGKKVEIITFYNISIISIIAILFVVAVTVWGVSLTVTGFMLKKKMKKRRENDE